MSLSIWQWLAERQIEIIEIAESEAEMSGLAFRITQEMQLKSLTPFDICSLADVLELPLSAVRKRSQPIAKLTIALLRFLSRQKSLRRSEGVWLAFQVAYLNALQAILDQEAQLKRPWLSRAMIPRRQGREYPLSDPQLQGVLKTLRPGRLSDSQAEQALSKMAESFFVKQMNNLASAWFLANGAENTEANLLTQRLVNGLPGYLLCVVAENALPLAQLQKFLRLGNLTSSSYSEDYSPVSSGETPINQEREYYRSHLLQQLSQPMLGETFALKDIYIPLKGSFRESVPGGTPVVKTVDLASWANSQLDDTSSIAIIEAGSGHGKTSFCQIWATQVAQTLYPQWMPILIPLQNVTLGETLEQTLSSAFPQGRFSDSDGWLSPVAPPCLLILDGWDELPRSPQKSRHLLFFLDQVIAFQAQCIRANQPPRHKIFITTRPGILDGLTGKYRLGSALPLKTQLQRIAILPMEQEELRQWFIKWSQLQSKSIAQSYFALLKGEGLFQKSFSIERISGLVRQPLMLYLLGLLHRDGLLDDQLLQSELPQAKLEIYERLLRWLFGEIPRGLNLVPELVREGLSHACRTPEAIANLLQGRQPGQLQAAMQQIALKLLQKNHWKHLDTDKSFWENHKPLPALFFRYRSQPTINYSYSGNSQEAILQQPTLSFSHNSFGVYLGAEEIATQLQILNQKTTNRYGEITFYLNSPSDVARHLYELLGYGILARDMEELIIERLRRQEQRNRQLFSFKVLFERLLNFYYGYCQGRWLDQGITHQATAKLEAQETSHNDAPHQSFNVLQVEATVGLNVFILLCITARLAGIPFLPCGHPQKNQDFDADRLLSLINRINLLSPTCFAQRALSSLSRLHLIGSRLNQAMLAEANLEAANLSMAELVGANLTYANFTKANLSWANLAGANLQGANLTGANLEGADLSGANLLGVNLRAANCRHTCLYQTQIDEGNRNFADRQGAVFTLEEFRNYGESLTITYESKQEFPATEILELDTSVPIESAAGEPILPNSAWEDTEAQVPSEDDYEGDTLIIAETEQTAPPAEIEDLDLANYVHAQSDDMR